MNLKKQLLFLFVFILGPLVSLGNSEPEIHFNPADYVYLYEANGDKGYYDALLHFIGFVNRRDGNITVDSAIIDAVKDTRVLLRVFLARQDLEEAAGKGYKMQSSGLVQLYDVYFRSRSFLGESVTLSPTRKLSPNTALISMRNYLTVKGIPDYFQVTLYYKTDDNATHEVSARLKAVVYQQVNRFVFPVNGSWWVAGSADPHSDHRWMTCEEFALDLGQLDQKGSTYKGHGVRLEDYYCFDREVVAVAEGEVVTVQNNRPDERSFLKQSGESLEDYENRSREFQLEILKTDIYLALGNYIVIRHLGDEYSCYAHLKQGSARVKRGDAVKKGQVIGNVGQSGNSTEPHLHFQVNDGPDPLYSRCKPVKFSNLRLFEDGSDSFIYAGDIVNTD